MLISRGTTLSMIYKRNYIKSENQKNRGKKNHIKQGKNTKGENQVSQLVLSSKFSNAPPQTSTNVTCIPSLPRTE